MSIAPPNDKLTGARVENSNHSKLALERVRLIDLLVRCVERNHLRLRLLTRQLFIRHQELRGHDENLYGS